MLLILQKKTNMKLFKNNKGIYKETTFVFIIFIGHIDISKYKHVVGCNEMRCAQMGKFGKRLLGKLIGSDKSCCCCGPSIVSVRKIKVDDKDIEIAGLDEEFEKYGAAGKAPENVDSEELMQNLVKINEIPEEELEKLKVAILKEYGIYWQEKKRKLY